MIVIKSGDASLQPTFYYYKEQDRQRVSNDTSKMLASQAGVFRGARFSSLP